MKQPIQIRRHPRPSVLGASLAAMALFALGACSTEPEPSAAEMQTSSAAATSNGLSESEPAPASAPSSPLADANDSNLVDPAPNTDPASSAVSPAAPAPAAMTSSNDQNTLAADATPAPETAPKTEIATFGAGCFWCIEAVLEQLDGVESVVSGYTGGETLNPTYAEICTGRTGHAEVVRVTFDPTILPYKDLLDWFWKSHDPTTLNRQGADRGTQYRSAIFVHSDEQRKIAETSKRDVQPTFEDPIVTEITDAPVFYEAEKKHQGFYFDNTSQGYCRAVIAPKLKKLGLKY